MTTIKEEKEKYFPRVMSTIKDGEFSGNNKQHILNFVDYVLSSSMSKSRILRYMDCLKKLDKSLKMDFKNTEEIDIRRVIAGLEQNPNYTEWTKHTYKVCIKRFFKYLNGDEEYPKKVKWIKCCMKKNMMTLPNEGELITMEEANKLIEACNHPRDKAFISMLWESGCRISELTGLRIRDVAFDDTGFIINVKGKTGMRRIRLISSTPYVSTWLDVQPFKNNPDMPLWVTISRRAKCRDIRYGSFCKILRTAFLQANIKKRCNPHFFRHSRATYMANHLTEFQMNQYFGWVQGSNMPSTYVHMSGKQIDNAIFMMNGLKSNEEIKETFTPKKCPRCSVINNHDTKLCINCAFILDEAEAMKVQKQKEGEMKGNELMNELMKDPEVLRLLTRKIGELGLFGKISE